MIMREMKDSGISWVGEIPNEWSVWRNKYIFKITKDIVLPSENYQLLSLTTTGIKEKDENDNGGKVPENYDGYQVVKENDLVMCLFDLDCSAVFSGLSPYNGMISPAYKVLKVKKRIANEQYYRYWFNYVGSKRFYKQYSKSLRFTLNADEFNRLFSLWPPLDEQQRIAEFLDRECVKIDGLKADIQAQIDTLEQYKRSVITEAVIHGLNPSAPRKDSKVWYGQIPSEWKELKGKYVFKQRNDRGNNVCLQLLSPTQKYGVIPQDKYEELTGMNAVKLNDSTNYALLKTIHKGDYCISLRSFQGGFEYSEYEGVVSPAYQVFYPIITIADGYYKYLFKEKGFIDVMNSYTMSLRDGKNIAFDDFGDTFIPVPPLDEQQEIADYLDNKCAEIEQIIADKKSQIETLDGYKKSLIYEYVTGKKEVYYV